VPAFLVANPLAEAVAAGRGRRLSDSYVRFHRLGLAARENWAPPCRTEAI
jgi:hypothetical protein